MTNQRADVSTDFIGCGCSKTPHSLDWSPCGGVVVFGSSRNVCLLKPETETTAPTIKKCFYRHNGDVNCVRFVKKTRKSSSNFVLSCGTDKKCILWMLEKSENLRKIEEVTLDDTVKHASGLLTDFSDFGGRICEGMLVATCSSGSTMKIWHIDNCTPSHQQFETVGLQTFNFGNDFALCSDFCRIKNGGALLAIGCSDNTIKLYYMNTIGVDNCKFHLVITLIGHDDWIRDVNFSSTAVEDEFLLASCSQDKYARIWRFSRKNYTASDGKIGIDEKNGEKLILKRQSFQVNPPDCADVCEVTLETILIGHDAWIYSARWHPIDNKLLTSSLDKSIIIWEPDPVAGVWLPKVQLGEIGGPVAGFYGAVFSPNGQFIAAHSFLGGLHCWKLTKNNDWKVTVMPTGHSQSVEDIIWDPRGNYLLSCSLDQTTRLYAPWKQANKETSYQEISRPQVHGYDMQCLAAVNSFCFVSGSEEKILRAFVAPTNFVQNISRFSQLDKKFVVDHLEGHGSVEAASVPALGLSNQAVFSEDLDAKSDDRCETIDEQQRYPLISYRRAELDEPPTEDFLAQNTLWPEVHKFVASNHAGTVIASACKASKAEHARVILWSTGDWQQKAQLEGHSLTVTQMEFSPDDQSFLTVSRDRTWCLYKKLSNDFAWDLAACSNQKNAVHSRIIWSCAWTHDSKYFATASRDKKVIIWNGQSQKSPCSPLSCQDTNESTTAIAFAPKATSDDRYLLAYGFESGLVCFFKWSPVANKPFSPLDVLTSCNLSHAGVVKKLRFKLADDQSNSEPDNFVLASCSEDHSVRIHSIKLCTP